MMMMIYNRNDDDDKDDDHVDDVNENDMIAQNAEKSEKASD